MTNRRIGKFTVHWDIVERGPFSDILCKLHFVPLEVTSHYYNNTIVYIGTSPKFDIVPDNIQTPEYVINIIEGEVGKVKDVTVSRC